MDSQRMYSKCAQALIFLPVLGFGLSCNETTPQATLSGPVAESTHGVVGSDLVVDGVIVTMNGFYEYDNIYVINGGQIIVDAYDGTGTTGRLILEAARRRNCRRCNIEHQCGFRRVSWRRSSRDLWCH
ncbi:MAG: hypothetical protein R3C68_17840 [Myxococcota bacterium]